MTKEIRIYDYVNHPYDRVRDTLRANAIEVFHVATKAAESRAESVAAELRVDLGAVAVGADILIEITGIEEKPAASGTAPSTTIRLQWKAARLPGLFPQMKAELAISPLTATETQLDFAGTYEPPMGALGGLLDAVAGSRIAGATVHRFVTAVADHLRRTLH